MICHVYMQDINVLSNHFAICKINQLWQGLITSHALPLLLSPNQTIIANCIHCIKIFHLSLSLSLSLSQHVQVKVHWGSLTVLLAMSRSVTIVPGVSYVTMTGTWGMGMSPALNLVTVLHSPSIPHRIIVPKHQVFKFGWITSIATEVRAGSKTANLRDGAPMTVTMATQPA